MAIYAISVTFTANVKNDDKAQELAERIGAYVQQERMAIEYAVVDIELLDEEQVEDELEDDE